jgi:hypothetical protein
MLLTSTALVIVPIIGTLGTKEGNNAMLALILVFSVVVLSGLGLLYASRRGDLSWVKPEGKR